jgi:hypothetical protein
VGNCFLPPTERPVELDSVPHRQSGGISKRECFTRFDHVNYWHSRTRDLIANAETYSYPAFRESFRELRREARKSEMELVIALFRFERAMNKAEVNSKS